MKLTKDTLIEGKIYKKGQEVRIKEARTYSPEFQKALSDVRNTKAGTAETLGRNTAMNPEVIYNWANKHGIELLMNTHNYMKDLSGFARAVMSDKPY